MALVREPDVTARAMPYTRPWGTDHAPPLGPLQVVNDNRLVA